MVRRVEKMVFVEKKGERVAMAGRVQCRAGNNMYKHVVVTPIKNQLTD